MSAYVVMAHRWGNTNDGSFPVHAGTDKDEALEVAEDYPSYRGGKYGCEVIEFDGGEDRYHRPNQKRVAYFPSMVGEKEPETDWLKYQLEHLGHVMWTAQRDKQVWLPERDEELGIEVLKPHDIDPPQWLIDEVTRAMKWVDKVKGVA